MRWLVLALCACAASAPPRGTPAPVAGTIPELDYFVGRWLAEAKNPMNGQTFALDYRVEPAIKGRWYIGTGHAEALGMEIHDLWGKDPVTGEIVRSIFDSTGTHGTVRSKGWSGDTLVLEGDATTVQGVVHVRETIEKKGADEFHTVWEMKTGEAWQAYSVETLRRQR
jgi:hypothetical protein